VVAQETRHQKRLSCSERVNQEGIKERMQIEKAVSPMLAGGGSVADKNCGLALERNGPRAGAKLKKRGWAPSKTGPFCKKAIRI